ncbi:matrilin-4-like [Argonauta hians]
MYGEHVDRETAFGLTRYTTKEDVLMAIKTLVNRDRYLMGHSTETGRAIAYARNYLFKNARPGASKICVVLTDGFSQNFDLTAEEASNARKDGIEMIAIGIGKEVSMKEVEAIASRPDLIFKIDSFDLLPRFQTSVMTKTCKKMYKIVNGTENKFPPGDGGDEDKCKDRQIDLNIVFRPSTVPPPYIVDLIDESISSDDMVGGVTKVGVITIPSVNINGFRLNNYENKAEIKQHFGRQDPGFILTPSLQDLRTEAFETRNGGRPDSRKVGLLIIDEKIRDIEQAVNETELARADGIDIFCMDIGASNSIGLLQGLTGGAEDSVVSVGTLQDIPPIGNLLIGKICMNTTRTD